jgi:hypothetical protein
MSAGYPPALNMPASGVAGLKGLVRPVDSSGDYKLKLTMRKISLVLLSALVIGNTFGAPVQITSLPFAITAPGTYTLASNLSCPQNQTAVTINAPVAGQIILDLAGFTLQPTGGLNDAIDVANPTGSKIVIRNGRLSGFWVGVEVNQQGYQTGGYVKNIHIENMTFYGVRFRSVVFVQVNSSSVTGCSFLTALAMSPAQYGIQDYYTQTGNVYSDDTFDGIGQTEALAVSFANTATAYAHFKVP